MGAERVSRLASAYRAEAAARPGHPATLTAYAALRDAVRAVVREDLALERATRAPTSMPPPVLALALGIIAAVGEPRRHRGAA